MMRTVAFLLVVGGCLYADDNTKPPPCVAAEAIPNQQLRNPQTGECQSFSYPAPCDPRCGQACDNTAVVSDPDWGSCSGACESLSEMQCLASTTCHATYQDSPTPTPTYWGCWELPPSGVASGSCANLDAQTCSEHPDCTSLYTSPVNAGPNFVEAFEKCVSKVAPPACSTLTTEMACKARPDCDTVYTGSNCTCDSHGCTCQTETFAHCQ
jgi:hypothetical protein